MNPRISEGTPIKIFLPQAIISKPLTSLVAICLVAVACLFSCDSRVKSVDFETAKQAYKDFDYRTALKGIKPHAERGNADAQRLLGKMYESGYGVQKDTQEGLKWYRLAAEKNNAEAEILIARLYDEGKGVPIDTTEAVKWFRRASDHGSGAASSRLATKYYWGSGVEADRYEAVRLGVLSAKQGDVTGYFLSEAAYSPKYPQPQEGNELRKWLKFGADNGVVTAQMSLGAMYYDGDGVPRNYTEAMRLFTLAAKPEGELAKSNSFVHMAESVLGDMFESGRGVAVDHTEAVKWFRLAVAAK